MVDTPPATIPENYSSKISLVIIFVVALLIIFWLTKVGINRPATTQSTPINKIENFNNGLISPDFPKNIPIKTGAKIVSSYNSTSPEGTLQATVSFESSESVSVNSKLYLDYFAKNKWKILAQDSSKSDLRIIIAQNDTGILNVTIHQGTSSDKSLVDLSFLVNK